MSMNYAELDLGDLRAFFLVAETGSFARAAARLEQAKSAVSRRVARLEEALSAKLLQRTAAGALLTEAGHVFYDEASLAIGQLQHATDSLSSVNGELSGPLRVTVPIYFGTHYLEPLFCEFMKLHPAVELEVQFSDDRLDLIRHGFDLSVRAGNLPDSSLVSRALTSSRRRLVASPEYLRTRPPILVPEDVSALNILHYNSVHTQELWKYYLDGEAIHLPIKPCMRSNCATMLMSAVVAGIGVTVMPNYIAQTYVKSRQAVEILPEVDWGVSPIQLLLPTGRHTSRRLRALIDFLAERFNGREV